VVERLDVKQRVFAGSGENIVSPASRPLGIPIHLMNQGRSDDLKAFWWDIF